MPCKGLACVWKGRPLMDLMKIPLMAAIKDRMQWLNRNQKVLAGNIANADTPGYKPQRLAEQDFSALVNSQNAAARKRAAGGPMVSQVSLLATRPGHMGESSQQGSVRVMDKDTGQSAPDGNAVDLENELLAVAQNQMDYNLMVELYRKQVGLLSVAMRTKD